MYISSYAGSAYSGYTPDQIKTAYNLPSTGGNGTTIAIIIAYHTPNIEQYFNTFSSQFGLPENNTETANFIVHQMASNIEEKSDWSMEACLDVQWAHAIAPQAKILLVEAVNASDSSLIAAVNYATSYSGVVAVSMSWGGEEFAGEQYYESVFYKTGIEFFVASGDDGTSVSWPAASAGVVSVGGTTLNLNPDGTVISETAWRNSSGGVSKYIDRPWYQTKFGLTYDNRTVPDVAYNGNPSTGVAVYNGTWWSVGGTSAGAPQWAAIHALNRTATNTNLYTSAKNSYSSYYRDITVGSNYVENATVGYDLVTGLGSPLTMNFGTQLSVSPNSGPAQTTVTLSGVGFSGNSVNMSYRNPLTASWVSIANNTATVNGNFTYTWDTLDLLGCNPSGDNSPQSDNIVFRATDNGDGNSYFTAFTEFKRGLSQVGSATAQGLYGNNTDLTATALVPRGVSVPVVGKWFRPGTASLLWDGVNVGSATIDATGSFMAALTFGDTTLGQHTLTVSDGALNFSVNVTCVPRTIPDYVDTWHTGDYTVTLTTDSPVNETFYRLNGGELQKISTDGHPTITLESGSNTLEYWSTWDPTENATIELPHVTLTGIKLDKTPPTGTIWTNPTTTSTYIVLSVSASDATSGVSQMRFSDDDSNWSPWEPYANSKSWAIPSGLGTKTIYAQFSDNAGLTSTASCTVTLQSVQTSSGTATPTTTPTPQATVEPTPAVPELNAPILFLLMLALASVLSATVLKRRRLL
ncbi:MAG: S53 family peptidase [Candidatus Bathyarchaeota archaeon]|nr:S53 family peptidase [Candidatus Bathyarchaeota archaeon]